MVTRPISIVSALLIAAMGAFLAVGNAQKLNKAKTAEDYWADTGLGSQTLEELLQEGSCRSSERYFFACVNAVQTVAQKYSFDLSTNGKLIPQAEKSRQAFSEKELLAPWKAYLASKPGIPNFPFLQIWKELVDKHIEKEKLSSVVGLGMNSFLSVFRDPHTYLLPAKMYNEVVAKANPKSLSIGVVIGRNDSQYFIKKVIENSSSQIAGLRKGDVLLSVNGHKAQDMTIQGLSDALRGEEGSTLKLTILRHGEVKWMTVLRTQQTLPTVSTQVLEGIKPVGVLTLNKFAIDACAEVKNGLESLKRQGIRGLLLDLRDNPGGQMDEAACIVGLFVGPGKKVFHVKPIVEDVEEEDEFTKEEQEYDGSLAVLINSGSASASEIVAGALQDYHRAILVGERTFGKGSFQEGEIWSKNSEIAIFETKGFYYLPSGRTPQLVGLEPDVKVNFKDRFALREEDQFLNPLTPPELTPSLGLGIVADLQPDLATCISFDSDLLPSDDPEMKEAHRVLSCRGIADRGTR